MSQICILALLWPWLNNIKLCGCSVFSARILHRPKLLSTGLSVRHYQGQSVTVNYTSLPPSQALVPQGQLHCVKFQIHNLVFSGQRMKLRNRSPLGSVRLFTHDWLKGQNKVVLTGISHAGGHFKFTTLYSLSIKRDQFLKSLSVLFKDFLCVVSIFLDMTRALN